jgi:cell division protein FtsB
MKLELISEEKFVEHYLMERDPSGFPFTAVSIHGIDSAERIRRLDAILTAVNAYDALKAEVERLRNENAALRYELKESRTR